MEYWYCPRFIYFMEVLAIAQHEDKRLKVKLGREVHRQKSLQAEYLRKKIGVVRQEKGVYLSAPSYGICGILDEILFMEDGSISLLDYKFAYDKHKYKTQFLQSVFYALLIEHHYHTAVKCGYVVYTREKNKLVKYDIGPGDKKEVLAALKEVRRIMAAGYFPPATRSKKRCPDCTYRKICVR